MKTYILAAGVAAAAVASTLAPASAQTTQHAYTNDPISVLDLKTSPGQYTPIGTEFWYGIEFIPQSGEATISFVNTGNVPAKSVEFAVRSGHRTHIIVDKGTFSPGVKIVHTFNEGPPFPRSSSVEVRSVTFADGSTWGS